eukprot:c22584_g1_i1 orf=278-1801(-)
MACGGGVSQMEVVVPTVAAAWASSLHGFSGPFSSIALSPSSPCKLRAWALRIMSLATVSPPPLQKKRLPQQRLAERILNSPQLALKTFPLLSSCLPPAPLGPLDYAWMEEFLPEVKAALGYPLAGMENPSEESLLYYMDSLLYLAFQHAHSGRSQTARYVKVGHSRLWFLGQYVLELALAELFLQRYPKEMPACIRERAFRLTSKKVLPNWVKAAAMDRVIFGDEDMGKLKANVREPVVKAVFGALVGVAYLTVGMGEVYRILFEVFGMDPDAKSCQPRPRLRQDEDYLSPEFEAKQVTWQDLAFYKPLPDSLFAKPALFRACVPPGMQRFRRNLWEVDSLPQVLQILGYPRPTVAESEDTTRARNEELELGLQLCYMHPSLYKIDHPRFCYERFEYLGQKIQDVLMAERLLMKHLDGPGDWLQEKHRRILFNRLCGKYLREKKLHRFILYGEARKEAFEKSRRLRNFATTAVQQALHGLAYAVYGKAEVRRLMFKVFDFEQSQAPT